VVGGIEMVTGISDRVQMNNHKRAQQYCTEALRLNPHSLYGLLAKAKQQLDADDFEPAIHTLKEAKEHHGGNQKIDQMMNEAQTLLRRSKQKDYYKVLGLTRDADDREIKKAYRSLTRTYHPDKATAQGISKEEAEKKMAAINEAYEVLSDPELKERFDRGDDPNDPHQGSPFQGSPFSQGAGGQQFFFKAPGRAVPVPPPLRKLVMFEHDNPQSRRYDWLLMFKLTDAFTGQGFPGGSFKFQGGGFQFPGGFGFP